MKEIVAGILRRNRYTADVGAGTCGNLLRHYLSDAVVGG